MTDAQALDAITQLLRDPKWGVGMLEDIAEIIERTGRDLDGNESTWIRH